MTQQQFETFINNVIRAVSNPDVALAKRKIAHHASAPEKMTEARRRELLNASYLGQQTLASEAEHTPEPVTARERDLLNASYLGQQTLARLEGRQ